MRKPEKGEMAAAALGFVFIIVAATMLDIPQAAGSLRIVAAAVKGTVLAAGAALALASAASWNMPQPLYRNSRVRGMMINLSVLAVTLVVVVAATEGALRLADSRPPYPDYSNADSVLHHRTPANLDAPFVTAEWSTTLRTNANGLRDDTIEPKENFALRILMLGDSFTFGYAVEQNETMSEVLQRMLRNSDVNVDVINAGMVSYSPLLEYIYLKHEGLQYAPDIVVLNFDMTDVRDDYVYAQSAVLENGVPVAVLPVQPKQDALRWLYYNTHLGNKIGNLFRQQATDDADISRNKLAITRDEKAVNEDEHWERTLGYITLAKEITESSNATFVLATYPHGHQVSGKEWAEGRKRFGFDEGKVYSGRPAAVLRRYAEQHNITLIDMFDGFRASADFPLFFPYDGHFTPAGSTLAGKLLFEGLVEKKIVKTGR